MFNSKPPPHSSAVPHGAAIVIPKGAPVPAETVATPEPAPEAVRKALEHWAETRGDIKPGWQAQNRYASSQSPHQNFAPVAFNVAMMRERWLPGQELTEAEYDEAIKAANAALGTPVPSAEVESAEDASTPAEPKGK